jgi:hypothetical protein
MSDEKELFQNQVIACRGTVCMTITEFSFYNTLHTTGVHEFSFVEWLFFCGLIFIYDVELSLTSYKYVFWVLVFTASFIIIMRGSTSFIFIYTADFIL